MNSYRILFTVLLGCVVGMGGCGDDNNNPGGSGEDGGTPGVGGAGGARVNGTGATGGTPSSFQKCLMDQGDIIVPFDAMPSEVLTLSRVEGTSDRYYVIIDGSYLDLFVGGFETLIETGFSEYQRVSLASKALVFVLDTRAVDCQSGDGVALEIGVSADEILSLISLATNGEESLDAAVLAYLQGAPGVEGMAAAIREAFEEGAVEVVEQTVEQVFLGFCEDLPFPLSAACP